MAASGSPAFVGRSNELSELVARVTDSPAAGVGVLVGGDAGVGKTRLVEELGDRLTDEGVAVASGRCIPTAHGSLPFVAVVEALSELCDRFEAEAVDEALTTSPELALLLPSRSHQIGEPHPVSSSELGAASQIQLFAAVSDLISTLSRSRRICLIIEDLHWADKSTRDLFVFLLHSLGDSRATLLGTYRSDEMSRSHPFRPVLAELDRSQLIHHMVLQPFDADELMGFATAVLGNAPSAGLLDELGDRSGGNAFFASEILGALAEGRHAVRPELTDLILGRIEALSAPTQEVMRMFAVSGRAVNDELLEEVTQLSPDEVVAALREAIDHQVVVLDPDGPLYFRHALMQEAVYGTLLPRERQRAHARYADALTQHPQLSATRDSRDAELAWHYREARNLSAALGASATAAKSAASVRAFPEALGHVETILELWDEVDDSEVLTGLDHCSALQWAAELAHAVGYYSRATQFQRSAIAEAEHLTETEQAELQIRLGRFLQTAGRPEESLAKYEEAVASVSAEPSPIRAQVLAGYGQQLMLSLRYDDAVAVLEEAIDIARQTGAAKTEAHALDSLGSVLLHLGLRQKGVDMLWTAYEMAREQDSPQEMLRSLLNLVSGLNEAGDLLEAERIGLAGLDLATEFGQDRGFGYFIASNHCETLSEMGRWDEAAAMADRINRPEGDLGDSWLLHHRTDRLLRQGKVEEATDILGRTDADAVRAVNPQLVPAYWTRVANLALTTGELSEAGMAVDRGLETAHVLSHVLTLRSMAIEVEAAKTEPDEQAVTRAREQLELMEQTAGERLPPDDDRSFRLHALLHQARATVADVAGENSAESWRSSAEAWHEGRFAWHEAQALFRLGSSLLRSGERDAAAAVLGDARDLTAAMGAEPLHRSTVQLIENARLDGEGDHASDSSGILTPREMSVLRLVADGRTNRQIGEELFISPKTVSVHVSRIFQKLQVENRTEAAAAARAAGLL